MKSDLNLVIIGGGIVVEPYKYQTIIMQSIKKVQQN